MDGDGVLGSMLEGLDSSTLEGMSSSQLNDVSSFMTDMQNGDVSGMFDMLTGNAASTLLGLMPSHQQGVMTKMASNKDSEYWHCPTPLI